MWLERVGERDGLRSDDVHQGTPLESGEDSRIDLLRNILVVGEDHTSAGAAKGFVGRGRHHIGKAERARVLSRGNEPSEMGHVDEEIGANLVADLAEALEVEVPW